MDPAIVYETGAQVTEPSDRVEIALPTGAKAFYDALMQAFSHSNTIDDPIPRDN
jgi:hypothetical protein